MSAWKALDLHPHLTSPLCPSGNSHAVYIPGYSLNFVFIVVCRVYVGNSCGEQSNHFGIAMRKVISHLHNLGFDVHEEFLTLKEARNRRLSAKLLVDWLLGSHIHFVITHPNQGWYTTTISIDDLYTEFSRLKYHPGFPMGAQLQCPIFTQNKWNYLKYLPSTMASCKILMAEGDEYLDAVECQVRR